MIKGLVGLIAVLVSYIKAEFLQKLPHTTIVKYMHIIFGSFFFATLVFLAYFLLTAEPNAEYIETEKIISSDVYTVYVGDTFPLYNSKNESPIRSHVYLGSPETKNGVIQLVIGRKGSQDPTQNMYVTVTPQEPIQPLERVQLNKREYASITFLEKKENAVVVRIDTILKELKYEPYDTESNREIKEFEQDLKRLDTKLKSFFNQ